MSLIFPLLTLRSDAATYHVSPQGKSTPPYGSFANAANHPSDAVAIADGYGDTVLIHAGQYSVDARISAPPGLTIIGVQADSVILSSTYTQNAQRIFSLGGDNEIAGLTLENPATAAARTVHGLWSDGALGVVRIHHCRLIQVECFGTPSDSLDFHDNYYEVGTGTGVRTTGGMSTRIYRNHFLQGNYAGGATFILAFGTEAVVFDNVFDLRYQVVNGQGILAIASSLSSLTVRNNLFIEGTVALNLGFHSCVFENNTIINTVASIRVILDAKPLPRSVTIRNNMMFGCQRIPEFTSCDDCKPGASITYVNNCLWPPVDSFWTPGGNLEKLTIVDSGNYSGFPMFTSDSAYRPQAFSPLIDRGDPSVLDLDGTRSDVGWTGGPGGMVHEYPDEAPGKPDSLSIDVDSCIATLNWSRRHEADLASYRVYRESQPILSTLGKSPYRVMDALDSSLVDTMSAGELPKFYAVSSLDSAEHEGPISDEARFGTCGDETGSGADELPRIVRVYPNPVSETAFIVIDVPDSQPGSVPIVISTYDIAGEFVEIAFEGIANPGQTVLDWTPRSSHGDRLAEGVYLLHLRSGEHFVESVYKVVLKR